MDFVHSTFPVAGFSRISATCSEAQKTPRASGVHEAPTPVDWPFPPDPSALRQGLQPAGAVPLGVVRGARASNSSTVLAGSSSTTATAAAPTPPRSATTATAANSFLPRRFRRTGPT